MQCFLCHGHEIETRPDSIGAVYSSCLTCGADFYTVDQWTAHQLRVDDLTDTLYWANVFSFDPAARQEAKRLRRLLAPVG